MKISIIGAGRIGTALAKIFFKAGHEIKTFDKNPSKGPNNIEEAVKEAEVLFLCVPSWAMREVIETAKPFLNPQAMAVSLAKGLEEKTVKTMDAVLEEVLPRDQVYFILGGPLMAEDLEKSGLGIAVAASKHKSSFADFKKTFEGTNIILEYSPNPTAVALAGVLKNIYALALGLADGLVWHENAKGWLTAAAINEMREISKILCGTDSEILGTAGIGDFIATAFSKASANRSDGEILAATGGPSKKSEGINSLPLLNQLLKDKANDFKVLKALTRIIGEPSQAKTIFESLFK